LVAGKIPKVSQVKFFVMGPQPEPSYISKLFTMATWSSLLLVKLNSTTLDQENIRSYLRTNNDFPPFCQQLVGNTVGFMSPEQQIVRFGNSDREIEAAESDAGRLHSHLLVENPFTGPIDWHLEGVARASPGQNPYLDHRLAEYGQIRYIVSYFCDTQSNIGFFHEGALIHWGPKSTEKTGELVHGSLTDTQKEDRSQIYNDGMCVVCLAEYGRGEQVLQLQKCHHIFHESCLRPWLEDQGTCPTCRSDLFDESEPNAKTQETTPSRSEWATTRIPVFTTCISRRPAPVLTVSRHDIINLIRAAVCACLWFAFSYFLFPGWSWRIPSQIQSSVTLLHLEVVHDGYLLVGNTVGFMSPEQQVARFGNPGRDIEAALEAEVAPLLSHPHAEDPIPGPIDLHFEGVARASAGQNFYLRNRLAGYGQIRYIEGALMHWDPKSDERTGENGEAHMVQSKIEQQSSSLVHGSSIDTHKEDSSQIYNDATCVVCLAEYGRGEQVLQLQKCQHIFHEGCLRPWLEYQGTCPTCRSALFDESEPNAKTQETTPSRSESASTRIPVLTTVRSRQPASVISRQPASVISRQPASVISRIGSRSDKNFLIYWLSSGMRAEFLLESSFDIEALASIS
ncbi:hypothetical protein PSHT_11097, partial [Puccinia striiformis]